MQPVNHAVVIVTNSYMYVHEGTALAEQWCMQHQDLEVLTVSNGATSRSRGLDCEQWCMHQDLEVLTVSNGATSRSRGLDCEQWCNIKIYRGLDCEQWCNIKI